jgi:chromosome segregation ATPase
MEARLADAFSDAAAAREEVQRLQLELIQAQAESEDTASLLQQLEAEKKLAAERLAALQSQVEAQAAEAATRALAFAQLEQQLDVLRSDSAAAVQASVAAEKRARVAEAALGDEVAEVAQLQSVLLSVQANAHALASGTVAAQRVAVLAALGAAPCCKEGACPRNGYRGFLACALTQAPYSLRLLQARSGCGQMQPRASLPTGRAGSPRSAAPAF